MAKADKEYADSLFNTVTNKVEELKERVTILESQIGIQTVPTEAQSPSGLTITLDDLRAMMLTEMSICIQQHHQRVEAEAEARKQKRAEEHAKNIEQQRKEAETESKVFFESSSKWQQQVYENLSTYYMKLATGLSITYRRIEKIDNKQSDQQSILDNILKLVTPPPPPIKPEPASIFANLPSGLRAKAQELRNRIKDRLQTYLKGSYTFQRGYTIVVIILYILLLVIFMISRITIMTRHP